jgi:hypothetical protein
MCVCVGGVGVAYNNRYNRNKISVQKKNRILTVIAKKIAKQQRE